MISFSSILNPQITCVEYSTDIAEIVELGAMSSPVLAINNEVVVSGKVPTEKEIETYILEKINL